MPSHLALPQTGHASYGLNNMSPTPRGGSAARLFMSALSPLAAVQVETCLNPQPFNAGSPEGSQTKRGLSSNMSRAVLDKWRTLASPCSVMSINDILLATKPFVQNGAPPTHTSSLRARNIKRCESPNSMEGNTSGRHLDLHSRLGKRI